MKKRMFALNIIKKPELPDAAANASTYQARYNKLTGMFLGSFSANHLSENIVFSPLSVITLLSMAADATVGASRREILDFLCGRDNAEIICTGLEAARDAVIKSPGLTSANAVAAKKELEKSSCWSSRKSWPGIMMDK